MKIKCPNCGFEGLAQEKTSCLLIGLSIILSIVLFPVGLIFPMILFYKSKHPKCPKCRFKYTIHE